MVYIKYVYPLKMEKINLFMGDNLSNINKDRLVEALVKQIKIAVTTLPDDVKTAIKNAYNRERNPVAKKILSSIIENFSLAEDHGIPMCQDTGTITWFIKVGKEFPLVTELSQLLIKATKIATDRVPIRPNAVDPFTGKNSGDNTGRFIPWINWEVTDGDEAEITVLPKGGGSEYTAQLRMVSPGLGIKGIKEAVLKTVFEAGGKPCPPIIVGVGIGGGADIAMKLGKLALLRPITERHENAQVAKLEEELYNELNSLGIGPMGLGGDTTVLGVNVEYAYRHPATLPVGIVTQCWAARRATIKVSSDGEIKVLSHSIDNIFEINLLGD